MKTSTIQRILALLGYVSFLAAAPALAQMGPIQPVLVTDGKIEYPHDRPDIGDFSVPVDVNVAANGSVTKTVISSSSGNEQADKLAADFMRQRKFLPAIDKNGKAVAGLVKVNVNMYKRSNRKVVRVTVKPPPVAQEALRLQTLMCADFLWEIDRMDKEAGTGDMSLEVMPYTSARMYMEQRKVPDKLEEKFWDEWPRALQKVVDRCEKDQTRMFFSEVLIPTLDGVMPPQTATASAR